MSIELQLTPHGTVNVQQGDAEELWMRNLLARFSESEPLGLFALATLRVPHHAHSSVFFWRDIAADFIRGLCHIPESESFNPADIEPPSRVQLAEWVLNVPPMWGAEYLTESVLRDVWKRLLDWTEQQLEVCGNLNEFLKTYASQWTRVGRVTLHLAENKGDGEYPFAFMATYSTGLSSGGRLSRLPLGKALQEYAGKGKKGELIKLLSPLHEAAKRSELIADLVETGDVFHPLVWTPKEAYAFLKEIPVYENCGLLASLPNWWQKRSRPRVNVTLGNPKSAMLGKDALLDFHLSLALGGEELSREEAEALLSATDGLILFRGSWVEVDSEKLQEALNHWEQVKQKVGSDGVSFIEGMRLLAGATSDLKADEAMRDHASWTLVKTSEGLRKTLASLRKPSGIDGNPPKGLRGSLRHYQKDGLNWLWLCSQLGVGSCLADDMGLGKTIQILATLLRQKEEERGKESRPSLLVVPASLIGNWKAEATRFAPELNLFIAHASESPKTILDEIADDPQNKLQTYNMVITTYSMVTRLNWLSTVNWEWIILDEAQAIKNPSTRQTKAIKKLNGFSRVALTGTPVENRMGDLWSLFDFLNPGLLGSATRFKSFVKSLEQREHAKYAPLRNLVSPYILRRMKTDPDIVPDLPEKTDMQVFCGLSKIQASLYKQSVSALAKSLHETEMDGIQRRGLVLSYLMRFKQICNHPSQLTGDGAYQPEASAKFKRLGDLCTEIASRGEKVLVFTQFREVTDALAEFLASIFGRSGLILHGGTSVAKRKNLVANFQQETGPPFFVLSIKAGGTGLNLTMASHVIHFDRWWNPAVENQATDRAFRIGQKRNVLVHKFVTRGTIEEKIDALIREKQEMVDALLNKGPEKTLTEMSDDEILNLVSLDIERATE